MIFFDMFCATKTEELGCNFLSKSINKLSHLSAGLSQYTMLACTDSKTKK
jgi:hypothetical protein